MVIISLNIFRVLSIITLGLIESSFNEKDQLTTLIDKIETFNNHYYENIYVHTNKEVFQPGDRLWFNAYVTGVAAKVSKSTTLYCRIANASGKKILMKRFQITDGLSGGDIELDKNLNNGNYRLTFFTKKSVASENNFTKEILIKNYHSEFEVSRSEIQNENVDQKFPIESIVYIGNDSLHVEIPSQEDIVDEIFLIVTIRGEVFWASEETLKLNNKISLALSELPAGMVTITGFNKSEIIILRNTIAINNSKLSSIAIKLDKPTYGSGEKTKLDILVVNENGIPIPANLSVSVYAKELNSTPSSKGIVKYMAKSENLEMCLSIQHPLDLKEELYIIKGFVAHPRKNLKGIPILAIDKMGEIYYETETDASGTFNINVDSTFYATEFLVGIENNKKDRLMIELEKDSIKVDTNELDKTSLSASPKLINTLSDSVYLKNYLDYQFLEEVIVQDGRTEQAPIAEVKSFHFFDNVKAEKIKNEEISVTVGQSFIDVLKQVTTLHYVNRGLGQVYFSKGYYNNTPVLFLLNNVAVGHDYRELDLVSSDLINEIMVIKDLGAVTQFGIRAQGGAVLISTKHVIANLVKPAEPLINPTMTKSAHFYETPNEFAQSEKLESCAFWKDHVIVDHNGKASLEFKNLPLGGTMIIRIEGVDINRNFISYEMSYKVN
jgi:hypothetical protein